MRVLITGAAGFLGRAFTAHHVEAGDTVVGVDDLSSRYARWPEELPALGAVQADARWFFATSGDRYDLAYHFAAPVGGREKIEGDPLFNAQSLGLDTAFFRWAVSHVPTVVYPSSSAVYGVRFQSGWDGVLRLKERFLDLRTTDDIPWPDQMYGFTKLAGEVLASRAAPYGLNTLCIRPFSGYGEDQSPEYPIPAIAGRVARREDPLVVWGSGTQIRDLIHVDDVVMATVKRLEAGFSGFAAMNIGSGAGVNFLTVAKLLATLEGYDPMIITDEDKPQGVHSRVSDNSVMLRFHEPQVSLRDGLERVLRAVRL